MNALIYWKVINLQTIHSYPMQTILVLGAGRSATSLIDYLASQAVEHAWQVIVADASLELAKEKVGAYPQAQAISLDVFDEAQRSQAIGQADVVVSLLPASLHPLVATQCLHHKKHLLTASYVSPEMRTHDAEAKANGLVFLNEMGLDPGIDHLSAMQIIDRIREQNGQITSFKSFCGGLIAPTWDTNPWGYKFTWNPRNVVLAGQGTAIFLENGQHQQLPYEQLFTRTEIIEVGTYGKFEAYPNRDSLGYQHVYGLPKVTTMLRGTLRKPGFCAAWNILVQLGLTNDSYTIPNSESLTYRQWMQTHLPGTASFNTRLAAKTGLSVTDAALQKVGWLELDANVPIGVPNATPAQILQKRLEEKWLLGPEDKDLIVMQHQFEYVLHGKQHRLISSLAVEGENAVHTAMAKTVGLPLGIATKLVVEGKITKRGVLVPVYKEIYEPILQELQGLGITFEESETSFN